MLIFSLTIRLKVHLHEIFLFSFSALIQHIYSRPKNLTLKFFWCCSWFRRLIGIFKHSAVAKLTQSLIPHQLSQRQVRLYVNWVNAEWDSTSTESTRNDKIFVNVGVFCVDSVDVESNSALTQLTWSLTPLWLSWRRVWLHINSVWGRLIKPRFRKINTEMFKWSQYQPENVNSFYIAWSKKSALH